MKSEVVETVTGRTTEEIRAARDRAVAGIVELRLDGVADLDVAGALAGRRTPVIVTCRAAWEGGRFDGSEEERLGVVAEAIARGAEFVDVEWRADRHALPALGATKLILSHHDFSGIPGDLPGRIRAMRAERPDIVKVAVTPARLADCVALRRLGAPGERQVLIAMGSVGQLSRVCPWLFGSCWTYGGAVAPGQIAAADLISLYRVPAGSAATAIYAIVGAPLGHSASPAMHNPAFAAEGLDAIYLALETDDAAECLEVAEAIGLAGASVTAPLKSSLLARVAAVDELATTTGALNTLRRRGAGWEGCNFDVAGFLAPLQAREVALAGRRAVVLGAGGAARTAIWALAAEGAVVEVAARAPGKAGRLAAEFGVRAAAWPPAPGWDLLVNATPAGTWPDVEASPLAREEVRGACVYDLVYNPEETKLLHWARAHGAETIGGLAMLVAQAERQFEWWTGRRAPAGVIEAGARAHVARTTRRSREP